jgi:hypothetical protein
MLCVTVWYGGTKLANSLVWLVVFNHGRLSSGSTSDGLITIAIPGFGGKVLIVGGAYLDVKPFSMPYGGFSSGSCLCVAPGDVPVVLWSLPLFRSTESRQSLETLFM